MHIATMTFIVEPLPRQALESRMIRFLLRFTPETRISVDELRSVAASALISELRTCGYTVHERGPNSMGTNDYDRMLEVTPGPAVMRVAADERTGSVQFELKGPAFGSSHEGRNDAVLWMRVITLGVRLETKHHVSADVSDPDYPIEK